MANISEATGCVDVTVKTNQKKEFTEFFNCLREFAGNGDYFAYIDEIAENDIEKEDDELFCSSGFYGAGRWTFHNNLELFGNWADSYKRTHKETVQTLEKYTFKLEFEFADYEPGCGVLYSENAEITHNAGEEIKNCKFSVCRCDDLPITAENLVDYEIYDEGQVADAGDFDDVKAFIERWADTDDMTKFSDDKIRKFCDEHRGEIIESDDIYWMLEDMN